MPPTSSACAAVTKPFVLCVEGNIASGKTSVVRLLHTYKSVRVFEEPVERWRNVQGEHGTHNLLQLFYENPRRWSFAFQDYVQLTMLQLHQEPIAETVKVMERSIHSARHCFVEHLHKTDKMSNTEYAVLTKWYDHLCDTRPIHPNVILYLKTTPDTVFERIRTRDRPEERQLPLQYLRELHELHEDWISHSCPYKVMNIDGNKSLEEVEHQVHHIFDNILRIEGVQIGSPGVRKE